jgi:hypothetical protein
MQLKCEKWGGGGYAEAKFNILQRYACNGDILVTVDDNMGGRATDVSGSLTI